MITTIKQIEEWFNNYYKNKHTYNEDQLLWADTCKNMLYWKLKTKDYKGVAK